MVKITNTSPYKKSLRFSQTNKNIYERTDDDDVFKIKSKKCLYFNKIRFLCFNKVTLINYWCIPQFR